LKAAQSPLPELKRVVLARGDGRVVMDRTLSLALERLLGEKPPQLVSLEPVGFEEGARVVEEEAAPPEAAPAEVPAEVPAVAPRVGELARQADRQLREARERLDQLEQTLEQLSEQVQQSQ
ncbi:MAG: hypothetical protein MUQ65_11535, partial [Armatimonadetes bacterium]|nr:hypothetical protein [Armatimonadota bacterium]